MFDDKKLTDEAKPLDTTTGKALSRHLKLGDFSGRAGQTQLLYDVGRLKAKRLLLVGLGPKKDWGELHSFIEKNLIV